MKILRVVERVLDILPVGERVLDILNVLYWNFSITNHHVLERFMKSLINSSNKSWIIKT